MRAAKRVFHFTRFAAAILVAVAFVAPQVSAESGLTKEELVRGLTKKYKVRGLTKKYKTRAPALGSPVIETDPNASDPQPASAAPGAPSIDLEVYFAYDSAELLPKAVPTLVTLGQALTDVRLAGGRFMVAGHTDAKGDDDYNLMLSQKRANAVRDFLVGSFGIAAHQLVPVGYGETQLKNQSAPEAGENRRVQIVNLTRQTN